MLSVVYCRLVTDVERTPLVVPFVHVGMQDLMPIGSKFPAVKKKVEISLDWLFVIIAILVSQSFLSPSFCSIVVSAFINYFVS